VGGAGTAQSITTGSGGTWNITQRWLPQSGTDDKHRVAAALGVHKGERVTRGPSNLSVKLAHPPSLPLAPRPAFLPPQSKVADGIVYNCTFIGLSAVLDGGLFPPSSRSPHPHRSIFPRVFSSAHPFIPGCGRAQALLTRRHTESGVGLRRSERRWDCAAACIHKDGCTHPPQGWGAGPQGTTRTRELLHPHGVHLPPAFSFESPPCAPCLPVTFILFF